MESVNMLCSLQEESVEDARSNDTCYSQVSSEVCLGGGFHFPKPALSKGQCKLNKGNFMKLNLVVKFIR